MSISLHTSFSFTPTAKQLLAMQMLNSFLASKSTLQLFLLRGFAGTGKTSILSHLAQEWEKSKKKVVLMAPTGRAARVLSSYCGIPAYTIHKKIYRLAEDTVGEMNFVLQRNNYVDTLFIVDEASMISSGSGGRDLLEDLLRFVFRGKGCRLILSGDSAQLPPVEMPYSPALDSQFLRDRFRIPVTELELDEVVRQAEESAILSNATRLRKALQTGKFGIRFAPDNRDVFSINGLELQEHLESCMHQYGMDEVLIITRSNKRANQFNMEIRNRLLYREEEIEAGDFLMAVKNNYHWLKDEEDKSDFIANGESMEVLKVLGKQSLYGYEFADVNVRFVNDRIPDIDIKIWLNSIRTEGPSLPQTDIRNLFYAVLDDYYAQGEDKNARQLAKSDPFFNALQVKFSYAVTCHKAQGGQWSAVFIDHGFLADEMVDENLIRWFYTAITRATQKVFLVNFNEMFL